MAEIFGGLGLGFSENLGNFELRDQGFLEIFEKLRVRGLGFGKILTRLEFFTVNEF